MNTKGLCTFWKFCVATQSCMEIDAGMQPTTPGILLRKKWHLLDAFSRLTGDFKIGQDVARESFCPCSISFKPAVCRIWNICVHVGLNNSTLVQLIVCKNAIDLTNSERWPYRLLCSFLFQLTARCSAPLGLFMHACRTCDSSTNKLTQMISTKMI